MPTRLTWHGPVAIRRIQGTVRGRVRNAATLLASAVREECPVDTGALRSTVRVESSTAGLQSTVLVGDESKEVDYAKFVHDGTSRQAANPFFLRAVYRVQPRINNTLAGRGLFG